jgi:hypothetical protein
MRSVPTSVLVGGITNVLFAGESGMGFPQTLRAGRCCPELFGESTQ